MMIYFLTMGHLNSISFLTAWVSNNLNSSDSAKASKNSWPISESNLWISGISTYYSLTSCSIGAGWKSSSIACCPIQIDVAQMLFKFDSFNIPLVISLAFPVCLILDSRYGMKFGRLCEIMTGRTSTIALEWWSISYPAMYSRTTLMYLYSSFSAWRWIDDFPSKLGRIGMWMRGLDLSSGKGWAT